jgi:Lysozyme like domain
MRRVVCVLSVLLISAFSLATAIGQPAHAATVSAPAITVTAVVKPLVISPEQRHLDHLAHLAHLAHLKDAGDPSQVVLTSSTSGIGGTLSCSGLENLWETAGGAHADAFMAAEIAMAESGGNQYALSPTDDYGYWQINASHGPAMATFNAMGNARAAIAISDDGTDWEAWTTYTAGLYEGRC